MIITLGDICVELLDTVLHQFESHIQENGTVESGGILLGGYIPLQHKYIITDVSVPNKYDKRGTVFFIRDYKMAQDIINAKWKESMGKINYLGEWHTHPCLNPYPSLVDRKLLQTIFGDKSNVWNEIFMIIIGQDNTFYIGVSDRKSNGVIIAEKQFGG